MPFPKKPEEISLWDIVEVMEGYYKNQQMSGGTDGFCSRHGTQFCMIRRYYQGLQNQMEEYLSGITIDKVLEREAAGEHAPVKRKIKLSDLHMLRITV